MALNAKTSYVEKKMDNALAVIKLHNEKRKLEIKTENVRKGRKVS